MSTQPPTVADGIRRFVEYHATCERCGGTEKCDDGCRGRESDPVGFGDLEYARDLLRAIQEDAK